MIYAIRTTSGREDIVIDIMSSKVRVQNLPVKALVHPAEIKGYIFAEGSSGAIHKAVQGLMHIRGIIEKPINLDEIKHFLEFKKDRIMVDEGSIVEIIGGPFRGEKGKITRVDAVKDEVTIELLDASIPIPVTIATEFIKILKRAEKDEAESKEEPKEEIRVEPRPVEPGPVESKPAEPEARKEPTEAEEEPSVFDVKEEEESPEKKESPEEAGSEEAPEKGETKEEKPAEKKEEVKEKREEKKKEKEAEESS